MPKHRFRPPWSVEETGLLHRLRAEASVAIPQAEVPRKLACHR
jgi:hypothetical protein